MFLFGSHSIMNDSDSSEFESVMRVSPFQLCTLVTCILTRGKSRKLKKKFQGKSRV